jgi:hypothetical protein
MKPLAQSMMLPLMFARYAIPSERASTIYRYNNVGLKPNQRMDCANKGETIG